MANETLRSVSINVAQERIHIRTDLPDTDLKEIVDFIESRLDNSSKFKLELKKQLCLLAVELTSEIVELRKQLRKAKSYHDLMDKDIRELSLQLDEALPKADSQV